MANLNVTNIDTADWTVNFIHGCKHGCYVDRGRCYADVLARTRLQRLIPCFTEPQYHMDDPEKWTMPVKKAGIVFVGSMSDVFGAWVPKDVILRHFDIVKVQPPEVTVYFCTKNPARYREFAHALKERTNVWLGATIDAGFRSGAPKVEERLKAIVDLDYPRKFVSLEPFDPSQVDWHLALKEYLVQVQWAILGFWTGKGGSTRGMRKKERMQAARIPPIFEEAGVPVFVKKSIAGYNKFYNKKWPRQFPKGMALATKHAELPDCEVFSRLDDFATVDLGLER